MKIHVPIVVIARLTGPQRDMLISHVDGEVTYRRGEAWQIRDALIKRGLLKTSNPYSSRPRATLLTEDGRRALGVILGAYADALVRAGWLDQETPMHVLRHLKALPRPGEVHETELGETALKNPDL